MLSTYLLNQDILKLFCTYLYGCYNMFIVFTFAKETSGANVKPGLDLAVLFTPFTPNTCLAGCTDVLRVL